MLLSLSIDNVAVIEKAEVEFDAGFNVLTGETGAGKSLLIDSLTMVLGMRTSKDLVRGAADAACVSALFSPAPDLSDLGFEPEEDSSVLLSRKLFSDGRNICKVNSRTVSLSVLRAVGERLVTIHGQDTNILLTKPAFRLSLLDEYSKDGELLSAYKVSYKKCREAKAALSAASVSEGERERQKDILSYKIDEITRVSPEAGEDLLLTERREALRSFGDVKLALENASEALSSAGGVKDRLYSAMKIISDAAVKDKTLSPIAEKLTDLYYGAEDAAFEIGSRASDMVFSSAELDEVEERLDLLTRLKKKYGPTLEDCISSCEEWQSELDALSDYEANISRLEGEARAAEREMLSVGAELEKAREAGARLLSEKVCSELHFLDMPKAKFGVSFSEHEPSETGLRGAEFMISTNPSEDLKPLSKIASGGEMSRIMLALKSVLAGCDDIGVLLFDEIDSGVSGRAAVKIASKLKALAKDKQVICVTHLPQLAARADSHLLVTKDTSSDSFRADVLRLDRLGRIKELSRLISGEETPSSLAAAEDMLTSN